MRSAARVLLGIVLGIVLIVVPLLVVQRAECRQGDRVEDEWSVAVPFQDQRQPRRCDEPRSGGELLLEFVRGE